jgi:hypothetical protein
MSETVYSEVPSCLFPSISSYISSLLQETVIPWEVEKQLRGNSWPLSFKMLGLRGPG